MRLTSQHALAEVAGPPSKPVIPESDAGIAAAARIGRDVDAGPGARNLSGATGSVKVERTIRGNRRKLFRSFAMVINWTRLWDPEDRLGWIYGGDGDPFEIGAYFYGYGDKDDVDQLCGSEGCIRTAFVEHKRPRYAQRTWEWMTRPPGDRVHRSAWQPVLPQPTRVTVRLEETKDGEGDPWTTVTLEHELLPVEWVEDMADWWNFQFAIADHRGFGTK